MMTPHRQRRLLVSAAGFVLLAVLLCAPLLCSQSEGSRSDNEALLKQHYDAAQNLQSAGKLEEAAHEYRLFIADALGQLALDRAHVGQYEKAAPLFDQALKLAPRSPILQIEYGRAALARGDLSRAKSLADEVLRAYPDNAKAAAKAHLILGRALLRLSKDQEARQQLEAAVALEPDFEDGYALAVVCLDMGDRASAARIFSEMTPAFGNAAVLHREFGRAYAKSDFPQGAIPELEKASVLAPRLPQVHYLLAVVYLATAGNAGSQSAERELRKELAVSPRDPLVYTALGQVALARRQYSEAEADLKRAVAQDPESCDAYFDLGKVFQETNRPGEAEASLRKYIALTADRSHNLDQLRTAHYLLGRLLVKSGREQQGRKEMQASAVLSQQDLAQDRRKLGDYLGDRSLPNDALTSDSMINPDASSTATEVAKYTNAKRLIDDFEKRIGPAIADSYNNLGAVAAVDKDYASASTYFAQAAVWNPSLQGLDYNWGKAAFSGGEFQEADIQLGHYLQFHPTDQDVRAMVGVCRFLRNDYAGALSVLQPIKSQLNSTPQLAYVYAASMVKTGELDLGIERLVALEQAHPDSADVHHELAAAYLQASRPQDAAREMHQYDALRGNSTARQGENDK
jgi:tetratricopeptide (TPR) repeat protein